MSSSPKRSDRFITKLAQEIEDFLLEQQVFTDITAGATASGGELRVWTPPPDYK